MISIFIGTLGWFVAVILWFLYKAQLDAHNKALDDMAKTVQEAKKRPLTDLQRKRRNARNVARKKKATLLKKRSNACEYCGERHLPKDLTVDHYRPLTDGGTNRQENLRLCCTKCNTKKANLSPEEWEKIIA